MPIEGIILLDKPQGLTSHSAMQQVKRILGAEKAGHTGSLDPLATGMLPICLGEATKFSQYLLSLDKTYIAKGELGVATTTGDSTGEICEQGPSTCSEEALCVALQSFIGTIQQIPPMYSALKHQGQPLYRYARKGQVIARAPRPVVVYALKLLAFDGHCFTIQAHVSKGTYIRTLVEDIGRSVGSCAHLYALRRLSVSGFENETMSTLSELNLAQCLPLEYTVSQLVAVRVSSSQKKLLYQGQVVKQHYPFEDLKIVSLWDEAAQFFGVGEYCLEGLLQVKRLRRMVDESNTN